MTLQHFYNLAKVYSTKKHYCIFFKFKTLIIERNEYFFFSESSINERKTVINLSIIGNRVFVCKPKKICGSLIPETL